MRSIDETADELYTLPPASFTPARDAAAAEARDAGDRAGARALTALKRPTQGAHLVNLLALRRPELVGDLIALGEQIRAAQGSVSAAQMRDLSNRRRAMIGAALAVCRTLATDAGSGAPTTAQVAEAEATLAAAMADPEAAQMVRAGRVVKALRYAGFGGGVGAIAAGGQGVRPERPSTVEPNGAAREREERAARKHLAQTEAELAGAQEQEQIANQAMDQIATELNRLRDALDEATKRLHAARTARHAAERDVARARAAVASWEDEA